MKLSVNQTETPISTAWQDETLLWVLREHLGLNSLKFGCGLGTCGACSVLVDGAVQRACVTPADSMVGRSIVTVEGLATGATLHPVQQAWLDHAVPQCGYCQCGQVMAAVGLLKKTPHPTDAQIDAAMSGNLCRCGTQQRIRAAIHAAAKSIATSKAVQS
jgi:isoquinoline 1-oxidoreductase subunit alpha